MIDSNLPETRDLLLSAAARVFAQRGFHAATIRQICELAGANVASINYHFGDKQNLYREVLASTFAGLAELAPPDGASGRMLSAVERFRVLVETMVRLLHAEGDGADGVRGRLLAWEVLEPSAEMAELARPWLEPAARHLLGEVREQVGPDADERTIQACGLMVLVQILFSPLCRGAASKLFPELSPPPTGIEPMANDIARLSIAAMHADVGVERDGIGPSRAVDAADTETEIHLL